jgi:hypothetical protein
VLFFANQRLAVCAGLALQVAPTFSWSIVFAVVSKGLATKNEPILISFERLDLPGFQNLEGLGQENRNKVWRHFQF